MIQTAGFASGDEFPVGLTNNSFIITDGVGNTSTCDFNVFVFDSEEPVLSCPDDQFITVSSNCSGTLPDYSSYLTTSDNCNSLVSIVQSPPIGSPIISNSVFDVLITAVYTNNETAECSFKVTTILDSIPNLPQAICKDIIVSLDENRNSNS